MECYRDRSFCASPNCENECGRKITNAERRDAQRLNAAIAWGYFCGLPTVTVDGHELYYGSGDTNIGMREESE